MTNIFIYTLVHPTTGEVRYVGLTRAPRARLRQHARANGTTNPHLIRWLRGLPAEPVMVILETLSLDVLHANARERHWIATLLGYGTPLLNATDGGEGGFLPTAEVRAKQSILAKARIAAGTHPFLDPAVRAKQAAAMKGIPHPWSAGCFTPLNKARTGISLGALHRQRISQALTGRVRSTATRVLDSQNAKARWTDPVRAAKMRTGQRKGGANPAGRLASLVTRLGVPLTAEHRAKVRIGQAASWTAERRLAASRQRKGHLVHPMTAEMRAKVSMGLKAYFARKRAEGAA